MIQLSQRDQPIRTIEDWFSCAPPRGGRFHWRDGHSAKELAKAWCGTGQPVVPLDFAALLNRIPVYGPLTPIRGHPEQRVHFDGLPGEPRNADLVLTCESPRGLVAVSVEAKARESFGDPVHTVIADAARRWAEEVSSNRIPRLQMLERALFRRRRPGAPPFGQLRYQLLTATAGALAYAAEIGAEAAVLVIHEFRPRGTPESRFADNARDLEMFLHRLSGDTPDPGEDVFGPFYLPGEEMVPAGMPFVVAKLISACDPFQPHDAANGPEA